jgi:hypothetical protein
VVKSDVDTINRFNGFCSSFAEKTVATVNVFFQNLATRLKPGMNDESFASGSEVCATGSCVSRLVWLSFAGLQPLLA